MDSLYDESEHVFNKLVKYHIKGVKRFHSQSRYLTLREEHRLRGFENRVLRRLFGPKRDQVGES
jgi:hypothetical protein